jgi:ribosomal protein L40E
MLRAAIIGPVTTVRLIRIVGTAIILIVAAIIARFPSYGATNAKEWFARLMFGVQTCPKCGARMTRGTSVCPRCRFPQP